MELWGYGAGWVCLSRSLGEACAEEETFQPTLRGLSLNIGNAKHENISLPVLSWTSDTKTPLLFPGAISVLTWSPIHTHLFWVHTLSLIFHLGESRSVGQLPRPSSLSVPWHVYSWSQRYLPDTTRQESQFYHHISKRHLLPWLRLQCSQPSVRALWVFSWQTKRAQISNCPLNLVMGQTAVVPQSSQASAQLINGSQGFGWIHETSIINMTTAQG